MGLFSWLHNREEKRYPVEQAVPLLNDLLQKKGFSKENPNLMLAWSVFQEFCLKYHFQCDDDAILWEVGPFCWRPDGSRVLQWHLVRQFICGTGEDDDIRQLCFDLDFSQGVGEGLQESLWSYDFNGDYAAFFAEVETRGEFQSSRNEVPGAATVYLDGV